jgi:hypothetical protein
MKRIAMALLAVFALLAVANPAEAQWRRGYSSGYYYPYTTGYYGPAYTTGYVYPGTVVGSSSYYYPSTGYTVPSTTYYPSTTYTYPSTSYYYPSTSYYYPSGGYYSAPLGTRVWIGR